MNRRRAVPALAVLLAAAFTSAAAQAASGLAPGSAGIAAPLAAASVSSASGTVHVWSETRRGVARVFAQRLDATGARQWPDTGLAVSGAAGDQTNPTVVPGSAGVTIVVWMNGVSGGVEMRAQALSDAGERLWGADGAGVGNSVGDSDAPSAASDGQGGVLIAWDEFADVHVYAQRIAANGALRWGANGLLVCTSSSLAIHPQIAGDGAAGGILVWQDRRAGNYDIYAARVDSAGALPWTPNGVAVCAAANDQWYPQLAGDGAGGAIAAWQDHRTGSADVFAQRLDATGARLWIPNGVVVCDTVGQQYAPVLAADGAGGAIVAWQDYRADPSAIVSDIYAQRLTGAGAGEWQPQGVRLCLAAGGQFAPALLPDGAGGATFAWEDLRAGSFDVYAQRVDASGAVQWAAGGVLACGAAGSQITPTIAADGSGGAVLGWPDARAGDADRYAQRLDSSGLAQWAANGAAVYLAPGRQFAPLAVAEGDGGAILVWKEKRAGDYDIVAARFGPTGTPVWPATRVCYAPGPQAPDDAIPDGAGGVIVAWSDPRGADADIYAQRVDSGGTPLWTTDGVAVCTAIGAQTLPRLASDGGEGAIIAWQDARGSNVDIYAQHLGALGTPAWTANGVVVCSAAGNQAKPRLVPDDAGGALLTWEDPRSGRAAVFAQRLTAPGTPAWTADGVQVAADTSGGGAHAPDIVRDGAGGAILAWQDPRGQVYAQRLDGAGAAQWAAGGVAMATTYRGGTSAPSLVADGAGGAIALWLANADTTFCPEACPSYTFGQRVSGSGQLEWLSTYGATIVPESAGQPVVATNGAGGAIAAWTESASAGVTVQDVDGAGLTHWGAGVPVAPDPAPRAAPSVAPLADGGAIVAWQESDGYRWLVHAQRFDAAGVRLWAHDDVTSVPPGAAPASGGIALGPARPSPARGAFRVAYAVPDAGPVTLELLDVSGRRIELQALETAGAGEHTATFGDRARLAPGVYLVRLRRGALARSIKVVVIE